MAKIKSITQFKERIDGAFETLKTRDEGMRLMRRVPCAVFVNLRKVTGDELRIVCSAVQYVGTTDPTVLPIRKMPLVLMSDPLDNHNVVVCGIAPQCRVVWCVVCSACQGAGNAGKQGRLPCSCEELASEANLKIAERGEDKADAQQASA